MVTPIRQFGIRTLIVRKNEVAIDRTINTGFVEAEDQDQTAVSYPPELNAYNDYLIQNAYLSGSGSDKAYVPVYDRLYALDSAYNWIKTFTPATFALLSGFYTLYFQDPAPDSDTGTGNMAASRWFVLTLFQSWRWPFNSNTGEASPMLPTSTLTPLTEADLVFWGYDYNTPTYEETTEPTGPTLGEIKANGNSNTQIRINSQILLSGDNPNEPRIVSNTELLFPIIRSLPGNL